MTLTEINPKLLEEKPFDLFTGQGALLTAGTLEKYNMMTIGWGTLGTLWGKPVATVYVRPSRFTYDFMEKNDTFSITTFGKEFVKILNVCGSKSGRDINKMEIEGLNPAELDNTVYFEEADLAIICKKIYVQDLLPERIPQNSKKTFYSSGDFHRVYYGEILQCLKEQN